MTMKFSRPALWMAFASGLSAGPAMGAHELLDLSLEELSSVEVVSVSRKAQRLADTPAAVTVLTRDDIRRSGAQSIPEVLRQVPGVQVARIGSGRWAVSVRGFNNRFSSKLLVQVDGRSVYSPLFSGVIWESLNLMLEDVERIEVVRGPGASLWGANAVNGVINIVTRRASATLGSLVRLSVDDTGRAEAAVRQGVELDSGAAMRLYARSVNRAPFEMADGSSARDEQSGWRAGFRVDSPGVDRWRVDGEVFRQRSPEVVVLPVVGTLDSNFDYEGAHLSAHRGGTWLGGDTSLRASLDYTRMSLSANVETEVTGADIDFQHRLPLVGRHEWIWGLGLRYQHSETAAQPVPLSFSPAVSNLQTFSAFVQDEITLVPKRWRLSAGARLEARNTTRPELQPSVRLLWTPTNRDSVWWHWSRAARTASLGELHARFVLGFGPYPPFPQAATVAVPNSALGSEHLNALEFGFRHQMETGYVEAVAFRHRYTDLISNGFGRVNFAGTFPPAPDIELIRGNNAAAVAEGLELGLDAAINRHVRLGAAYTLMRVAYDTRGDAVQVAADADRANRNANHWLVLTAHFDLPAQQWVDVQWRYGGALRAQPAPGVDSYAVTDLRYARQLNPAFELSLTITNLFDERHTEFSSDYFPSPYAYDGRRVVLTGRWQF